jgi:hypothetical protein
MERRVTQPEAAQVRSSLLIGEGEGIFPGRLPFIDPFRGFTSPFRPVIRTRTATGFRAQLRSL